MNTAMMRSTPLSTLVAVMVSLAACGADAQEAKKADAKPQASSLPEGEGLPQLPTAVDWYDAAFDGYVNLSLLDEACSLKDSKLLTDVALQFVEGERILLRSHQAISAEKLLTMATKLATQKQDQESLKRIARSAESRGDKQLAARVAAAIKFSGETRAVKPAVMVNPGAISAAAVSDYQGFLDAISTASLIGGRSMLEQIDKDLTASDLPDDLRAAASKKLQAALKALPKDDAAADALAALSGVSRQIRFSGGGVRIGIGRRNAGGSNQGGIQITAGGGGSGPGFSFGIGGGGASQPSQPRFGGGSSQPRFGGGGTGSSQPRFGGGGTGSSQPRFGGGSSQPRFGGGGGGSSQQLFGTGGRTSAPISIQRVEQLVLQYINQYRASVRAPALQDNGELTNMARQHSQSMAQRRSVDHAGVRQRYDIMMRMGARGVAENVASANPGTEDQIARQAVQMWIGSAEHRQNLSNSSFSVSGIGVAQSGNDIYLTQLFAGQ